MQNIPHKNNDMIDSFCLMGFRSIDLHRNKNFRSLSGSLGKYHTRSSYCTSNRSSSRFGSVGKLRQRNIPGNKDIKLW